ncbi:hypothetical protein GCM10010519_41320 [Streptomyces lactacystinicus]
MGFGHQRPRRAPAHPVLHRAVHPPELTGSHVGAATAHTTGRTSPVPIRLATAPFGHAGTEWDITACSEEELERLTAWVGLHKRLRPSLHGRRTVRADHPDPSARRGLAGHRRPVDRRGFDPRVGGGAVRRRPGGAAGRPRRQPAVELHVVLDQRTARAGRAGAARVRYRRRTARGELRSRITGD